MHAVGVAGGDILTTPSHQCMGVDGSGGTDIFSPVGVAEGVSIVVTSTRNSF